MQHPDSLELSGLLDGELSPSRARDLEEHLKECTRCAALLADLQAIHRRARELPEHLPARDLWPEIHGSIGEGEREDSDVIRLHPSPASSPPGHGRGVFLSLPRAIAAGLVLALASGAVGARLSRVMESPGASAVTAAAENAAPAWVEMVVDARPALRSRAMEVARLERSLAELRDELDASTAAILERNLTVIDGAIQESVMALREDPGNRFLESNLERAVLSKAEYLRDAARFVLPST